MTEKKSRHPRCGGCLGLVSGGQKRSISRENRRPLQSTQTPQSATAKRTCGRAEFDRSPGWAGNISTNRYDPPHSSGAVQDLSNWSANRHHRQREGRSLRHVTIITTRDVKAFSRIPVTLSSVLAMAGLVARNHEKAAQDRRMRSRTQTPLREAIPPR